MVLTKEYLLILLEKEWEDKVCAILDWYGIEYLECEGLVEDLISLLRENYCERTRDSSKS